MTAKDVLKLAKEKGARIVDLRFIDLPGLWQHFSIPVSELNEEIFEDGLGFDGSSIRGFQTIDESDMLLIPDPNTAVMDPFTAVPTLVVICNVKDPVTGKWYTRDPRYIAQKAEGASEEDRARRHRPHRPGARVLLLRLDPLRPELQHRPRGQLDPHARRAPFEQGAKAEGSEEHQPWDERRQVAGPIAVPAMPLVESGDQHHVREHTEQRRHDQPRQGQ